MSNLSKRFDMINKNDYYQGEIEGRKCLKCNTYEECKRQTGLSYEVWRMSHDYVPNIKIWHYKDGIRYDTLADEKELRRISILSI